MGARENILLLAIDFFQDRFQCTYSHFSGETNSEWAKLMFGTPQGTKHAALFFLAVINFVLSEFEDRFNNVEDL